MSVQPWAIWILIALISGFLELFVPSFTFSFAAIGALFTALVSNWMGWEIQLAFFAISSSLCIWLFRPKLMARFHNKHKIPSRSESMHGHIGEVTQEILPDRMDGRVTVNGQDWAAKSEQALAVGKKIKVVASDGIVLIVKEH